jgi:hypothetical protein
MRRAPFLLIAVALVLTTAAPAAGAPTSSDPTTAATAAAVWLAHQVGPQGFIPSATDPAAPNLSASVQAVTAMAAAGVGRDQVDALLGYLATHVDAFVVRGGVDDAGALSYLILAARAGGRDPASFGPSHVDLVSRLQATEQPTGRFGAQDPTFDGTFRQGLALMALHSVGLSDATATTWLVDQQCANGLWTAFRADTTTPCPAVDPSMFTGPDTNSTALAVLGLHAQGRTTEPANGATGLGAVRNPSGAWGFLARADQPTDANSTGLVVTALRAVSGSRDAKGTAALVALQIGCTGDPADRGGVAFQPDASGALVPDLLATNQATPALAGVVLPQASPTIATDLPDVCAPSTSTSSTTTAVASGANAEGATEVLGESTNAGELPATGSSSRALTGEALMLIGAGACVVSAAERRRARLARRR